MRGTQWYFDNWTAEQWTDAISGSTGSLYEIRYLIEEGEWRYAIICTPQRIIMVKIWKETWFSVTDFSEIMFTDDESKAIYPANLRVLTSKLVAERIDNWRREKQSARQKEIDTILKGTK